MCEWVGGSGGCISRKKRKKEGQVDELIFFYQVNILVETWSK